MHAPTYPTLARSGAPYRDQRVINPRDAAEVNFWADEFDVPPSKLVAVVNEVGRTVAEIRRCLTT